MAKLSTSTVFGDLLVDGTIYGNVTGNLTGNASTATSATSATSAGKWSTARTLTIGNTGKSVDGSANVSWTLTEIGAFPKTGGLITGNSSIEHGTANLEAMFKTVRTDTKTSVWLGVGSGGINHGVYSDVLDKWMLYADTNGVYVNGSAEKLKTARNITIGDKTNNFDGSANISWTLADIGAKAVEPTTFKIQTNYVAVRTAGRTAAQYYEFWDTDAGWAGIKAGAIYDNSNRVYSASNKPTPADIGAAASSHGTHVTYSTTTPKVAGTAAVGSESTVARGDHVHAAQTSVSGNAGTATTLQTARTLTIGASGKSFNGSANVTWSHNDIQVARTMSMPSASASVSYVKLMTFSDAGTGNIHGEALISGIGDYGGDAHAICLIRISGRGNRRVEMVKLTPNSNGTVEIGYVRDDTNAQTTVYLKRATYDGVGKITILSEIGCAFETSLTSTTTAPTGYTAGSNQSMYSTLNPQKDITGNAGTATKLKNARTITIGNKSNTFDGSGNITFSLSDIGVGETIVAVNSNLTNVNINGFDSMMTTVNSNLNKL